MAEKFSYEPPIEGLETDNLRKATVLWQEYVSLHNTLKIYLKNVDIPRMSKCEYQVTDGFIRDMMHAINAGLHFTLQGQQEPTSNKANEFNKIIHKGLLEEAETGLFAMLQSLQMLGTTLVAYTDLLYPIYAPQDATVYEVERMRELPEEKLLAAKVAFMKQAMALFLLPNIADLAGKETLDAIHNVCRVIDVKDNPKMLEKTVLEMVGAIGDFSLKEL